MPEGEARSALAARAVLEAAQAVGHGVAVVEIRPGSPPSPRILYVNEALAGLLGRTLEDAIAQPPFELVAPEDRERLSAALGARVRGETPSPRHECEIVAKDGTRVPVDLGVHLFDENGRTYEVLLVRDLREQRAAEERARASERRFRTLVEAAPDGVVISRRGVVAYANAAAARILAVDPTTFVGRSLAEFMSPEDTERMRARMAAIAQGQRLAPIEYRAQRADGGVAVAEIASIPFELDGAPAMLAFARDVTERASMQAELARADRLAGLGRLAAGMAHEINNPLGFVALSAEALERRLEATAMDGEEQRAMLELVAHIRQGVTRVAGIVRDLKAFGRDSTGAPSRIDLRTVLDAATRMVAHELLPRGRLEQDVPAKLPAVVGDAGRLEQVFVNLLVNAAQALPEATRGVVTLRARVEPASVVVDVIDTGVGIAPEMLERVFDPFVTTKRAGDGMGLGLSICHAIVRALGGDITIESALGRGTTVSVRLVRAAEDSPRSVPPVPGRPEAERRAQVLVVEDTPAFAQMIRHVLAEAHEVTTALGVEEARAALARAGAAFDVVLCDMMLRDGTGIDVVELARAAVPGLDERFVFMTGGTFTPRVADFLDRSTRPRLAKPFSIAELETAIAGVLAEPASA